MMLEKREGLWKVLDIITTEDTATGVDVMTSVACGELKNKKKKNALDIGIRCIRKTTKTIFFF